MRRLVLVLVSGLFVLGCGEGLGELGEGGADTGTRSSGLTQRLRIVAGNLTSGTQQSYDPGHGARIFDGLNPDLVLIQEFNASDLSGFVSHTFGPEFTWVRGGAGEQIPNGVISRYPIRASGTWADARVNGTRGFTWALVDVPGDTDVFAVSVHLSTSSATTRNAEANALVSLITANAPAGAWVVIGGDLNTNSRTESALGTLGRVVTTGSPWPVDRNGNANTNASRSKPYDWVLVSSGLQARRTTTTVGAQTFTNGLVADTRVFSPIAELAPALSGDSGVSGMQHMAVVRDFSLDVADEPPPPPPPSGEAQVIINEVLANEPGSNTAAEFVELVNAGSAAADLSGWTLSDAVAVRHTFPAGTTLAAGKALVITGATASTGALGLGNSGDTVRLAQGATTIDSLSYPSSLSGVDGVSMTRTTDGDPTAGFVLHTSVSSLTSSPGTRASGAAF